MVDALAWMGVFLGFAALAAAGTALGQVAALRKEVAGLREELRRAGGRGAASRSPTGSPAEPGAAADGGA